MVHENTEYGNSVASVIAEQFAKDGLPVTQKIAYSANSSDVQPQVLQLKEKNPDVVIFISYTSDAILYTKTMKELELEARDHDRRQCRLQRSGLRQEHVARLVEGLVNRSTFAGGKPGSVPALFNELYKKKTGGDDLDDVSARGLQGFLVMADAINRAGSTDPAKIQRRAQGHQPAGRPDGDGLRRREVRRQGPERPGVEPGHADARRQVRRDLAQGARHRPRSILPYKGW